MAIRLGYRLGPIRTWRVMQVLGESGAAAASERLREQHPVGALARAVSRREFLKGAGGVVVGAGVLAGFGWVPMVSNGTARAQTQEQVKEYTLRPILGKERDDLVTYQHQNNDRFRALWNRFRDAGHRPRPDAALAVEVTISEGGLDRKAVDLKVPFDRLGQQYPVLSATGPTLDTPAANIVVAAFQRASSTNTASRADIYGAVRRNGQVSTRYERSLLGPFPSVGAAPPPVPGCEESYGVAAQLTKYGCASGSAVVCAGACLSFEGSLADLSGCNSICGAAYGAYCFLDQSDTNTLVQEFLCKYETAIEIVRNSEEYKELEESLRRKSGDNQATYDFDNAYFRVTSDGYFATVGLAAIVEEKIVSVAIFRVNYHKRTVKLVKGQDYTPHSRGQTRGAVKVTPLVDDGASPASPYYIVGLYKNPQGVIREEYVETSDGDRKTPEEFEEEIERYNSQQPTAQQRATQGTVTAQQYSEEYVQCTRDLQDQINEQATSCYTAATGLYVVGGALAFTPAAPAAPFAFFVGTALGASCRIYSVSREDPYVQCQGL